LNDRSSPVMPMSRGRPASSVSQSSWSNSTGSGGNSFSRGTQAGATSQAAAAPAPAPAPAQSQLAAQQYYIQQMQQSGYVPYTYGYSAPYGYVDPQQYYASYAVQQGNEEQEDQTEDNRWAGSAEAYRRNYYGQYLYSPEAYNNRSAPNPRTEQAGSQGARYPAASAPSAASASTTAPSNDARVQALRNYFYQQQQYLAAAAAAQQQQPEGNSAGTSQTDEWSAEERQQYLLLRMQQFMQQQQLYQRRVAAQRAAEEEVERQPSDAPAARQTSAPSSAIPPSTTEASHDAPRSGQRPSVAEKSRAAGGFRPRDTPPGSGAQPVHHATPSQPLASQQRHAASSSSERPRGPRSGSPATARSPGADSQPKRDRKPRDPLAERPTRSSQEPRSERKDWRKPAQADPVADPAVSTSVLPLAPASDVSRPQPPRQPKEKVDRVPRVPQQKKVYAPKKADETTVPSADAPAPRRSPAKKPQWKPRAEASTSTGKSEPSQ
jgi:hypothetical protein